MGRWAAREQPKEGRGGKDIEYGLLRGLLGMADRRFLGLLPEHSVGQTSDLQAVQLWSDWQ